MLSQTTTGAAPKKVVSPRHALLESLIDIVAQHVNEQLLALAGRLSAALLDGAQAGDARAVQPRLKAGTLLRHNSYGFLHLASTRLERAVRLELAQLAPGPKSAAKPAQAMTLVPYEQMDTQVAFGALSRPFDVQYADQLATLNVRLAFLLDREIVRSNQNPFRPELFLMCLQETWCDFVPDPASSKLLLPMLKPGLFLDLGPMLEALNLALMRKGVLPGAADALRGRRADSHDATPKAPKGPSQAALAQQLRHFFAQAEAAAPVPAQAFDLPLPNLPNLPASPSQPSQPGQPASGWQQGAAQGFRGAVDNALAHKLSQIGAKQPLLSYLALLQAGPAPAAASTTGASAGAGARPHNVIYLPTIKQSAPQGSLSRADESTIDLLSAIFETVFQDKNISQEIRDLIRFLQIPVLKAALVDKDFFFQEAHPARRMIDLLSRMGWEQRKGPEDPLFQAMRRSVDRVGREFGQEVSVFSRAVTELEASMQAEELAAATAIAEPIASALKHERLAQAAVAAKSAVALRLGSGEVMAVVEAFLENQWVAVMTIAHSVEAERAGAVDNATRAMDELIWSVKPKPLADERRQFIGKLPGLLSALNKWLDVIQWRDAGRLQFFAELAECHASIVRAPLELSPERQVEIALEVAQQAAQRRVERESRAAAGPPAPEPAPADDAALEVDALQRGMWMSFAQADGSRRKVKLAWISPLRTLFIFSADSRREAFSLSGEALAQQFREQHVELVQIDGMVGRALQRALEQAAVNDAGVAPG